MDRRATGIPMPARQPLSRQLALFDTRQISLGGRGVEYRFARRRRRTLGITVDATGLAVSAPMRAPFRDIESFLRDKEGWILAKLEEWSRVPRPAEITVSNGETLPLFGNEVTLEVREGG